MVLLRPTMIVALFTADVTCASTVDELATHAPRLADMHRRVHKGEGAAVAHELRSDPHAEIMRVHSCNATTGCGKRARAGERAAFPIVAASGMGDSCFNAGMLSLASIAGEHLGVYSRCIPTGDNVITDTLNSFLMTMDGNVDEFATRVRAGKGAILLAVHRGRFSEGFDFTDEMARLILLVGVPYPPIRDA